MRPTFAVRIAVSALLAGITTAAAAPAPHRCAADAIERGMPLLKLHFETTDELGSAGVQPNVKVLPPIRALRGNARLDVLEVWAYVNKADYRMRFIYRQSKGDCTLMGQEILDASDPN
jgi:hypothetical protein